MGKTKNKRANAKIKRAGTGESAGFFAVPPLSRIAEPGTGYACVANDGIRGSFP